MPSARIRSASSTDPAHPSATVGGPHRATERITDIAPIRWRARSAAASAPDRSGNESLGRRDVHQEWNALVQSPDRFGVGPVDVGRPRTVELFQVIDQVHLPVRRDPPVHVLHGGGLVPDRIGEQRQGQY